MTAFKVVLATGNQGKIKELTATVARLGWEAVPLSHFDVSMPEETETTYEGNALLKARAICAATGLAALADDSGLEVEALNQQPGVYSARFGNKNSDPERYQYLLDMLGNNPIRTAKFVSVIVVAYPDGTFESHRGELYGEITTEPKGTHGFGYDPVFYVPEYQKTMAELTLGQKHQISHRGKALAQLLQAHGLRAEG